VLFYLDEYEDPPNVGGRVEAEEKMTEHHDDSDNLAMFIVVGVALGGGIGAAIGTALGHVALGVGISSAIGVAVAVAIWCSRQSDGDE
jgi:hypothetical protein